MKYLASRIQSSFSPWGPRRGGVGLPPLVKPILIKSGTSSSYVSKIARYKILSNTFQQFSSFTCELRSVYTYTMKLIGVFLQRFFANPSKSIIMSGMKLHSSSSYPVILKTELCPTMHMKGTGLCVELSSTCS
jgi:hypothetical protein